MSNQEIVEEIVLKTRKVFNHKRYEELLENPPSTLISYHDNKSTYIVDKDWFRKQCQYVYNLVFKNLDILGLYGGEEGTGKSTKASQDGNSLYYIMTECNVLNEELGTWYEYNEENCLAHNLISFLKKADKYNDSVFRILICDEAGGLKSEERWDEWNKKFREEMRKDRKKLRVRLLCYPQPFELVKDFTLARVNYIRLAEFREDPKKGLVPDMVKTIIIPRGKFTFSFNTHELIAKKEIKIALLEQTKERYSKELHQKYIYKISKTSSTFCFDVAKYMENAKEENRLFLREEKIYLSSNLIRILAENLTAGKIGLSIKIDKDLSLEERTIKEKERKDALLISKLVNNCRKVSRKDKSNIDNYEDEE
jgi:hypothetical protein